MKASPRPLTKAMVKRALSALGMTFDHVECEEYRVNFKGGREGTAYYTDDLRDALDTGIAMSREGEGPAPDWREDPSMPAIDSDDDTPDLATDDTTFAFVTSDAGGTGDVKIRSCLGIAAAVDHARHILSVRGDAMSVEIADRENTIAAMRDRAFSSIVVTRDSVAHFKTPAAP